MLWDKPPSPAHSPREEQVKKKPNKKELDPLPVGISVVRMTGSCENIDFRRPHKGMVYLQFSCRFYVTLTDSFLYRNVGKVQNQWIHLVMNYIGPMENEGFEVFQDGSLVQVQLGRGDYDGIPGNGSLVIGKRYVDEDNKYVSMDLDELVFFNRKLMAPEVMKIYNNENCSYYQSP